ncbi:hypothetical protein [Micromonospora inaquosa]|uniref:hypothetical protein n=1 Tax=Micromonospora inaquosa TaxID=2203716 RepID=UPI003F4D1E39
MVLAAGSPQHVIYDTAPTLSAWPEVDVCLQGDLQAAMPQRPLDFLRVHLEDSIVAGELRRVIEEHGVEIPAHIRGIDHPLEVLRFTATTGTPSPVVRGECGEVDVVRAVARND